MSINFESYINDLSEDLNKQNISYSDKTDKAKKIADRILQAQSGNPFFNANIKPEAIESLKKAWVSFLNEHEGQIDKDLEKKIDKVFRIFFRQNTFEDKKKFLEKIKASRNIQKVFDQLKDAYEKENINNDFILDALIILAQKNALLTFNFAQTLLKDKKLLIKLYTRIAQEHPLIMASMLPKISDLKEEEFITLCEIILMKEPKLLRQTLNLPISQQAKKKLYTSYLKQKLPYIPPEAFMECCGMPDLEEQRFHMLQATNELVGEYLKDGICFGTTLALIEKDFEKHGFSASRARFLQSVHLMEIEKATEYFYQLGKLVYDLNSLEIFQLYSQIYHIKDLESLLKNPTKEFFQNLGNITYSLLHTPDEKLKEKKVKLFNLKSSINNLIPQNFKNVKLNLKYDLPEEFAKKLNFIPATSSKLLHSNEELFNYLQKEKTLNKNLKYRIYISYKKKNEKVVMSEHSIFFSLDPPSFADVNDWDEKNHCPNFHKFASSDEAIMMFMAYLTSNYENIESAEVLGYST